MEFFKLRKNTLLLLGFLLFFSVSLIFLAISSITPSSSPTNEIPLSPTPTVSSITPQPTFTYSPSYIQESKNINESQTTILQKDKAVSDFQDSLPYQGTYIFVYYEITNNSVIVQMNASKQKEAEEELSTLLKKYTIEQRSWVPNLIFVTQ